MIESGFNTHAYSSAAASGLWQFIRSTGRLYGLDSDYWVDERRDPEKATLAAAQHLKDLYGEFGDWYLAFAAYNAGSGKVRRAIAGTGSNNFWDLANSRYLRQETKDYVPKLLAAAIIAKSPAKYGFDDVIFQDPIAIEKVTLTSPTDVEVIAECAGVDEDLIRLINPELIRNMTPPNRSNYQVNVPRGTKSSFERKYARLNSSEKLKNVQYVARNGDTLREIAVENGVSLSSLMNANPGLGNRLHSGQTVLLVRAYDSPPSVPFSSAAYPTATKGSRLLDLIADNHSDKKLEKNKKKKEKQEKLVAKEEALPSAEMKVTWKEASLTGQEKSSGVLESTANAGEALGAPKTADALPSVSGATANDSNKGELANAAVPETNPATTSTTENTDSQIAAALDKVDANSDSENTPEDATGAVRLKSSGQVASLDKTNKKKIPEKTISVKVKRGETLTQIANKYGVTLAELKEWNKLKGKGHVIVGQKLLVKASGETGKEVLNNTTTARLDKKSSKVSKKSSSKVIAYKVRKGDTINKIAKKYDASPSEILGMNGLSKKAALKPGVVLKVKAKSGQDEG